MPPPWFGHWNNATSKFYWDITIIIIQCFINIFSFFSFVTSLWNTMIPKTSKFCLKEGSNERVSRVQHHHLHLQRLVLS
jgi:hypothetical protein